MTPHVWPRGLHRLTLIGGFLVSAACIGGSADETTDVERVEDDVEHVSSSQRVLDDVARQLDADLASLDTALVETSGELRAELAPAVEQLRQERADLDERLNALHDVTAPRWDETRTELVASARQLQRTVHRLELEATIDKDRFLEALERRLNDIESQLETARQYLADTGQSTGSPLGSTRDDLLAERAELVETWRHMRDGAAEDWHDTKDAMIAAWERTQAETDRLLARLRAHDEE